MTRVYLEVGAKRTLALVLDWPGWCRGGRNEEEALNALLAAAARYGRVVSHAGLTFEPPPDLPGLVIAERVKGNATTDFGAPAVILASDAAPLEGEELNRGQALLRACWEAFDRATARAAGHELRKGPRGGGRDLDAIRGHVFEAEAAYAERIGIRLGGSAQTRTPDLEVAMSNGRERILAGLADIAAIGAPPPGPRGGARWPARYFIRRAAYHVTDHLWEIEDRLEPAPGV